MTPKSQSKLKSQFKKLLHEQLAKNVQEIKTFNHAETKTAESPEKSKEDIQVKLFFKKDVTKTILISSAIIGVLIILSVVLNQNNNMQKIVDWLSKLL